MEQDKQTVTPLADRTKDAILEFGEKVQALAFENPNVDVVVVGVVLITDYENKKASRLGIQMMPEGYLEGDLAQQLRWAADLVEKKA